MARRKNAHVGSSVESFLEEEGILASSTVKAVKAVIAWQIAEEMKRKGLNKNSDGRAHGYKSRAAEPIVGRGSRCHARNDCARGKSPGQKNRS